MATTLDKMSGLVLRLLDAKDDQAAAEKRLADRKEYVRLLEQETIPAIMQELGIDSYKLNTGETVTIVNEVSVGIPPAKKPEAYNWLEENGFGGLIKTEVITQFTKGEMNAAVKLATKLTAEGRTTAVERNIHYQTLKAFIKEQMVEGNEIPLDLFGGQSYFTTKVKKAK